MSIREMIHECVRKSLGRWDTQAGIVAMVALVSLGAGGCRTGTTASRSNPQAVLKAYAAAIKAGDYDRAYALMAQGYRKRVGREDFTRNLRENREEVTQLGTFLDSKADNLRVEASLTYDSQGDRLHLVQEGGRWKIASDPLDFYSQRTPADALRSFIKAIEGKRYDIVLRFVPTKWAESMTVDKLRQQWEGEQRQEVAALLKNLKANIQAPIHISGETARMPYGDKFVVRFVLEDGLWKIEDPD